MEESKLIRGKNLIKNLFLKTHRVNNNHGEGKKPTYPVSRKPNLGLIDRDYEVIAKVDNEGKKIPRSITISDLIPSRHRDIQPARSEQVEANPNFNEDTDSTTTLRSNSTLGKTKFDYNRRYSSYIESCDNSGYEGIYGLPISMSSFGYHNQQDSPIHSVDKGSESECYRRFPTLEAPIASSELSELTSLSSEAQVYETSRMIKGKVYDLDSVKRRKQQAPVENCQDETNRHVIDNRKRLTQSMHVTSNEKADKIYAYAVKMANSPSNQAFHTNSLTFINNLTSTNSQQTLVEENTRIELNVGGKKKIAVFNNRNLKLSLANLKELFEKAFSLQDWNIKDCKIEIYNRDQETYMPLENIRQLTDCSILRLVPTKMDSQMRLTNDTTANQYTQKSNLYSSEKLRSPQNGRGENYFVLAKSPINGEYPMGQSNQNPLIKNDSCTCPIDHHRENEVQKVTSPNTNVAFQQGHVIYAYPGQLVQIGNNIFQIPHKSNSTSPNVNNTVQMYENENDKCPKRHVAKIDGNKICGGESINLELVDCHNQNSTLSNSSLDSAYSTRSNTSSEMNRVPTHPVMHQRLSNYHQEMKKLKSEILTLRTMHKDALGNFNTDMTLIRKSMQQLSLHLREIPNTKNRIKLSQMSSALRQNVYLTKRNRTRLTEWMNDLEVVINNLREDALSKWYRINNDEVEVFERQLSHLVDNLTKQKKKIPELREVWEDMKKLENNERITISEYLENDENRLDQDIQKCRKMNSTLFTIKRLSNVNKKKSNLYQKISMHTIKDPKVEDHQNLFEMINAIHPDHNQRVCAINKYQNIIEKKKKILNQSINLNEENPGALKSFKKNLEDHVIYEAFREKSRNPYLHDQIDFEMSDVDSEIGDKSEQDDSYCDADDQFCLINQQTTQGQEESNTLERKKRVLNTILKTNNNNNNNGNSGHSQTHTRQRERLVFSKHVLIEDGTETTELNCPMSDIDDQISLHDGNDSGIGFSSSIKQNSSLLMNTTPNNNNPSYNNPWRPLTGFHPGNKVVDEFPKIRSLPKVQGDSQQHNSCQSKPRSIIL